MTRALSAFGLLTLVATAAVIGNLFSTKQVLVYANDDKEVGHRTNVLRTSVPIAPRTLVRCQEEIEQVFAPRVHPWYLLHRTSVRGEHPLTPIDRKSCGRSKNKRSSEGNPGVLRDNDARSRLSALGSRDRHGRRVKVFIDCAFASKPP